MNKKVISLVENELRGKIITEFVSLRPKTYSSLTDDDKKLKKAKGTKNCVREKILKFNDYKNCLFKNEMIIKSQQRFEIEEHCVYTEEVNKFTNAFKACKNEMLGKYK